MGELRGQVAIVTGGARGIGRGIVEQLAEAGVDLVVADVLADEAAMTATRVEAMGRRSMAVTCDVRDPASMAAVVERTMREMGRLDIVCANAGVLHMMPLEDLPLAEFERTLQVNLLGVFVTCQAALPVFKAQGHGCYVNTASVAGLRGGLNLGHYSASKAGVIALTQSMALEYGRYGVRANCVLPGTVVTELSLAAALEVGIDRGAGAQAIENAALPRMPLGRIQTPADIGQAVVYLCQADNVSGISINVSGGSVL